jgi:hypothetical protein
LKRVNAVTGESDTQRRRRREARIVILPDIYSKL